MKQEKAYLLLNRQLIDIIANSERILNGNDSSEELESFARYSNELKRYVDERIEDEAFRKACNEIPTIHYELTQIHFWQYLLLPAWWISLFIDYQARKVIKTKVKIAQEKYRRLHILAQNQLN
ncbi:hypothetical protein [Labilibaculum filiforme]|nr:hypothetical protein [Labilibaculum filiforme]